MKLMQSINTQYAILNTHNLSFSKLDFPQAFKYIRDIMHNKYGGFPYYQKDYKMNDGKVFLSFKVISIVVCTFSV